MQKVRANNKPSDSYRFTRFVSIIISVRKYSSQFVLHEIVQQLSSRESVCLINECNGISTSYMLVQTKIFNSSLRNISSLYVYGKFCYELISLINKLLEKIDRAASKPLGFQLFVPAAPIKKHCWAPPIFLTI